MTGGDENNAGTVTIAGLTITADSTGTGGNQGLHGIFLDSAGTALLTTTSGDNTNLIISYQDSATLEHLKTAIDSFSGSKDVISASIPDMDAYDGTALLIDILGVTANLEDAELILVTDDDSPTANPTGTKHNTGSVYSYEAEGKLPPEDYIIN